MLTFKCRFPESLCATDYATDSAVISNIYLTNKTDGEISNVSIRIRCNPNLLSFPVLTVKAIASGELLELKPEITLTPEYYKIENAIHVELSVTAYISQDILCESYEKVQVFPYNHWDGKHADKLASFIVNNDTAVNAVLTRAEYYLRQWTGNDKKSGYLYDVPGRPKYTFQAITNSLSELSLNKVYKDNISSPQSILLPKDIANLKKCSEIELALFVSSCLFSAKLNPIICLTQKNILIGCWLRKIKLSEPILTDKQDIIDFVDTCNDDIAWFHMDNIFCSGGNYDISYGFVFANKFLNRHIDEIQSIMDIRAIRSKGVYTIKTNDNNHANLPDYQESSESLTEESKIDYSVIINKYTDERRKVVSALRRDTIYIEILNFLYHKWCTDTHSLTDPDIVKYLSDYQFHSTILTEDEERSLYEMRNKVILRLINHLAHPNIKYGKFVKELVGVNKSDSILIYDDDTGGLISMIGGDCRSMTIITDNFQSRVVYAVWKCFKQYNNIFFSQDATAEFRHEYNKVFVVVSRDANTDNMCKFLDTLLQVGHDEIIISFSEGIFNNLWERIDYNILNKYIRYISNIYYIPSGIAEMNDAKYLVRYKNKVQNSIEMTNGLLIPRSSFLNSFSQVKAEEKKNNDDIVSKRINILSSIWAKTIYNERNPFDPRTWTIPYESYCYIGDILSVLSSKEESHKTINERFFSVDKLMSICKERHKCYKYDTSSNTYESITEYENIGAKYYRLTKPVIVMYPLGLDAYVWKSLGKISSDKHLLNYKILIIKDISESNPLIVKDDNRVLIFEPYLSENIDEICKFIRKDIFFAKQIDVYHKFYTNRQIKMYLHQIIAPLSLMEAQEQKATRLAQNEINLLISKYRQHPNEPELNIDTMVENVLALAKTIGIANEYNQMKDNTALADLLVLLEYVRPEDGWAHISWAWKGQHNHNNRALLREELKGHPLQWKLFDKVFINKKGIHISKTLLAASFRNNQRLDFKAGDIILEVMKRYESDINYEVKA